MEPTLHVDDLWVSYGKREAVRGLSLTLRPGRCHALLGRNGAGKTSTLKALLGLAPVSRGQVRVFGLELARAEREVKQRLAYVPDAPGFYPWMSVRDALDYAASFRARWDRDLERQLLERFELDASANAAQLSKGQRTQLALVCALAFDPELLILDEPTSGLDPHVRRQFLEAVIGAFQDRDPERKTLLVSTHLISEFEGLVDDFTVMEGGRALMSLAAEDARSRYRRVRAWFEERTPSALSVETVLPLRREARMVEALVEREHEAASRELNALGATRIEVAALSLEEIFLATTDRARITRPTLHAI